MRVFEGNSIQACYKELIEELLKQDNIGQTKEIANCSIVVNNPSIRHYYLPYRELSEKYLIEESKWYWSADNSCETIGKYAKMWYKLSDDGKTNNSAYGYILFKKYGFNQLEQIIELLKKDKETRRAVLNISDPAIDRINTKDMQCTIAIQFLIRNDSLEETVYMRSNDVYFGLPYDYFFFVSIGQYIAKELGISLSKYTHTSTSMHMYLRDIEKFKEYPVKYYDINIDEIIGENYEK